MSPLTDFVTRTHTRSAGPMPAHTIGLTQARDIAASVDWSLMEAIAIEAGQYLTLVMDELASLQVAHERAPERMRVRAFLFGIATPHRDEAQAIAWARSVESLIDELDPDGMARHQYPSPVHGRPVSLGTYGAIAGAIKSGFSRAVWHGNLADIEATPGIGPKVARMIQAVLDPHANTWTVDLWHARQLLFASGREYAVAARVSKTGYGILEGVWLTYKARFFPTYPTFAVQWASWCVAEGKFVSHAALWKDLAEG